MISLHAFLILLITKGELTLQTGAVLLGTGATNPLYYSFLSSGIRNPGVFQWIYGK